jgi:O-antigen/teichoic acid export membrane protein
LPAEPSTTTRRNLVLNIIIQTLGAASSLLVVVALARVAGPAVQGEYAVFKSLVDVQVALLTLGLPSGFVYVINKGLVPASVVARWSARGIPAFLLVGGLITTGYLVQRDGGARHDLAMTAGFLTVAVAATTFYALMRGIVLTQTDGAGFAWLSAFPSLSLMVLATLGVASGWWSLESSFAASGVIAAVAAVALHRSSRLRREAHVPLIVTVAGSTWVTLRKQSSHSFLQGLFQGGTIFITIAVMQLLGARVEDVGHFNAASLATVGPNLLVAMVAPVLYSRWTRTLSRETRRPLLKRSLGIAVVLQAFALVLIPLAPALLAFLLGEDYRSAGVAMIPLLLAVLPLAATRIIAPALQATGDTSVATVAWGIRLCAPLALAPLAIWLMDDVVLWATCASASGEYIALAAMLVLERRQLRLNRA